MKKKNVLNLMVLLLTGTLLSSCGEGQVGPQGPQGEAGHTPVITIGENGNWFIDGEDTNVKAQGEKGETGAQGETGVAGPQGEKGDKGDTGAAGAQGETGATGPQGEKGETGATGPQGEAGLSAYQLFLKYVPEYTGSEADFIADLAKGKLAKYFYDDVEATLIDRLVDNQKYTAWAYTSDAGVINYSNPENQWWDGEFASLQWGDVNNPTRTIEAGVAFTLEATMSYVAFAQYSSVYLSVGNHSDGADQLGVGCNMYRQRTNMGSWQDFKWIAEGGECTNANNWVGQSLEFTIKLDVAEDGSMVGYINGIKEYEFAAGTFTGGEVGFYVYAVTSAVIKNVSLKINQ